MINSFNVKNQPLFKLITKNAQKKRKHLPFIFIFLNWYKVPKIKLWYQPLNSQIFRAFYSSIIINHQRSTLLLRHSQLLKNNYNQYSFLSLKLFFKDFYLAFFLCLWFITKPPIFKNSLALNFNLLFKKTEPLKLQIFEFNHKYL